MSETKRVAFVVNPNSGPKRGEDIIALISQNLSDKTPYDILVWEHANNFEYIRQQITSGKYSVVVAVGGDGTVNAVAKNLVNTGITMGIIPRGSGNGLARTLGIPMKTVDAIKRIETGSIRTIDNGIINGKAFFCAAGLGFDAHVAGLFAGNKTRGLLSYIQIILNQFFTYKSKEYAIEMDGNTLKIKAFLIAFANAGQYGNDFYIAPEAKMDDGLLHLVILKPINPLSVCYLIVKVLTRKAHLSKNILTFTSKNIKIKNLTTEAIHFDGEPDKIENAIEVSINPASLQVIS
jgi:YegS/Rv2252/BmrU family lipid kinase